ncbi:MAG TPA: Ig-like domain-containing protein [Longimicrobiaceae bacterium]|nr:Ig-like domain-containing protein [Longimicrobiaceae bacterium]
MSTPNALTRALRLLVLLSLALVVSTCSDYFVEPASPDPASMAIALAVPPALEAVAGTGAVFEKADAVFIQLTKAGSTVLDTILPFDPAGDDPRLQLGVQISPPADTLELLVEIQSGGQALFRGSGSVVLRLAQTSPVEVELSPVAASVQVPDSVPVIGRIGDTIQLVGEVLFATGDTIPGLLPTWSSEHPEIVEVDSTGRAIARSEGDANLIASFKDLLATVTVTVRASIAAIVVEPASVELLPDSTAQLSAQARDSGGNALSRVVEWTSADPKIAVVSETGEVRGVSPGKVSIVASSEGVSGAATVTVLAPIRISVTPPAATIEAGATVQLTATLTGTESTEVIWSSSDSTTARVDVDGTVVGVSVGTARITAAAANDPSVNATSAITVVRPTVEAVSVTPVSDTLEIEEEAQLTATITDARENELTDRDVTWRSSDKAVAQVTSDGLVTAMDYGEAIIVATSEGVADSAYITVVGPLAIFVTPSSVILNAEHDVQFSATLRDAFGNILANPAVVWSSSDSMTVRIDSTGLALAWSYGSATVKATYADDPSIFGTAEVSVQESMPPVDSIAFEPTPEAANLAEGDSLQLVVTLYDAENNVLTDREISWTITADDEYATVSDSGLVHAIKQGVAYVTATAEGQTAEIKITIVDGGA